MLETVLPRVAIFPAMDATAAPDPDPTLTELAALGLRAARVVTRMMEIEQAAADIAARWLPTAETSPASLSEAIAAGQDADALTLAMAQAVPRVEVLALALDRVTRSVRRSVALMRRLQAGWPRAASDDRGAMVRRQVARAVAETIRSHADDDAAERLFDELAARMDDPALLDEILTLPVDQVVRRICRDLGLAAEALASPSSPQREPPPLDTG
jgi:hypothetical protein